MSDLLTSNITKMGIVKFSYDMASQATIDTDEDTVTVLGLEVGDACVVSADAHFDGIGICEARCVTADTLSITVVNPTAGSVNPGSVAYTLLWFRSDRTSVNAIT